MSVIATLVLHFLSYPGAPTLAPEPGASGVDEFG
jgi:hypothetical protein